MMLCLGLWAAAGDLNPSAPPTAGTMKPLDQIEPRIAVNAQNTPGNSSYVFCITQPGSYYLTGPISLSVNKAGIQIAASNVTLDLMGFQIETTYPDSGTDGIIFSGKNIVIKNGTIRGFRNGIFNGTVNDADIQILAVKVFDSRYRGIYLNTSGSGSYTGGGILVRDCVAENNGMAGIQVGNAARVENCISNRNQAGIVCGEGGRITGCTASYNAEAGIIPGINTIVENNSCIHNGTSGIDASNGSGCTIRANNASYNQWPIWDFCGSGVCGGG
jgi:parallel beta-helix repeat protein